MTLDWIRVTIATKPNFFTSVYKIYIFNYLLVYS